ncbi:BBE domain-containing protein [Kribbella sp. NPDC026596]
MGAIVLGRAATAHEAKYDPDNVFHRNQNISTAV